MICKDKLNDKPPWLQHCIKAKSQEVGAASELLEGW